MDIAFAAKIDGVNLILYRDDMITNSHVLAAMRDQEIVTIKESDGDNQPRYAMLNGSVFSEVLGVSNKQALSRLAQLFNTRDSVALLTLFRNILTYISLDTSSDDVVKNDVATLTHLLSLGRPKAAVQVINELHMIFHTEAHQYLGVVTLLISADPDASTDEDDEEDDDN